MNIKYAIDQYACDMQSCPCVHIFCYMFMSYAPECARDCVSHRLPRPPQASRRAIGA